MPPIMGFALYALLVAVVWAVASKRGLKGWVWGLLCLPLGFLAVVIVSNAGGNGTAAAVGAFVVPGLVLFAVLAMGTSAQQAVEKGQHGDYRKCPFCAEAVRKDAIKCKHCGSEIGNAAAATPAQAVD